MKRNTPISKLLTTVTLALSLLAAPAMAERVFAMTKKTEYGAIVQVIDTGTMDECQKWRRDESETLHKRLDNLVLHVRTVRDDPLFRLQEMAAIGGNWRTPSQRYEHEQELKRQGKLKGLRQTQKAYQRKITELRWMDEEIKQIRGTRVLCEVQ